VAARNPQSGAGYSAGIQWISDGPELPVDVLDALEDGELVIFCGAGVSVRAGLPTFKGQTYIAISARIDVTAGIQAPLRLQPVVMKGLHTESGDRRGQSRLT
jgi:hypothetical protein